MAQLAAPVRGPSRPGLAFRCRLGLVGGVGGDGEIELPLEGYAYCLASSHVQSVPHGWSLTPSGLVIGDKFLNSFPPKGGLSTPTNKT